MEARRSVRKLLRAAMKHDCRPSLKSLLPLPAPHVEFPLSDELAPPLARLVSQAIRAPNLGSSKDATAITDATRILQSSLRRGEIYSWRQAHELTKAYLDATDVPASPNLQWFHARLEEHSAVARLSAAPPGLRSSQPSARMQTPSVFQRSGGSSGANGSSQSKQLRSDMSVRLGADSSPPPGEDALDVLQQMLAVGCKPPRQLWEGAILTLATSDAPRAFERALSAFWLYESISPNWAGKPIATSLIMGAASAPPPAVSASAAPSLVSAAAAAPAWRALSIMEAFSAVSIFPNDAALNRCLQGAAERVCHPSSHPRADPRALSAWLADGRRRLRRVCAALDAASSALGVAALSRDTHLALVLAAERCADPATAVAQCVSLKRHGGCPPPEAVQSLLGAAVSAGDGSSAQWLQAELRINPPKAPTGFGSGEDYPSPLGHYVSEASGGGPAGSGGEGASIGGPNPSAPRRTPPQPCGEV